MRYATLLFALAVLAPAVAPAQVAIHPMTTTPAAWERFALRVINQTDTATVAVRIEVPEALSILGVEADPAWRFQVIPQTDSSPAAIEWAGGAVRRGEVREFAFLGRTQADAKQNDLVLPVRITRASGSVVEWRNYPGRDYAAPRVRVVGTVGISGRGAMMMAGVAIGISLLALIIVLGRSAAGRRA
jgi:uncharacterized protein YcnI